MKVVANIGYSKSGRSINFDYQTSGSSAGGEVETVRFLAALANNNPNINFYITGKSNYTRLKEKKPEVLDSIFDYDNVIDCWANPNKDMENFLSQYFSSVGVKLDAHIVNTGPSTDKAIPNVIMHRRENRPAKIAMFCYSYITPIISFINQNQDIPVYEIRPDLRFQLTDHKDLLATPTLFAQTLETMTQNRITSYEDHTMLQIERPGIYTHFEKAFMYRAGEPSKNRDRDALFVSVMNEHKDRFKFIKEWVLQNFNEDISIYGKWKHPEAQPESDPRFRGLIDWFELQGILNNTRSSFCMETHGWITSKYVEQIHAGVVPIIHHMYDKYNLMGKVADWPKELKPNTPKEFKAIVDKLADKHYYIDTIDMLQDTYCRPEFYDGTFIAEQTLGKIIPEYKLPDLTQFEHLRRKTISLEDFFSKKDH